MKTDKSFTYSDFAEQYLRIGSVSGAEAMANCPFHDSAGYTMQFNLDKGLFICFSCGEKGSIKRLASHFGLANFREVEPDIRKVMEKLDLLRHPKKERTKVYPESYLDRFKFPTTYWGFCKDDPRPPKDCTGRVGCRHHRWLTQQTIEAFDLGYDPLGNRATIPARNMNGDLLGIIYRNLNDPDPEEEDGFLRYKYPKGFSRKDHMHGSWLLAEHESNLACIVEGSIDTAKVWQAQVPALGQYGSSITPNQIRLMRRLGIGEVVFFFDNDEAGRKALRYAKGMRKRTHRGKVYWEYDPSTDLRREFLVRAVRYTRRMGSDPGSCTGKMIRHAVDMAERIV